jgi:hypothetical protein
VAGDTIATLAARTRIRTLEEQGEYLQSRGSLQRRGRATAKAASEIAALGVKYQLCSRETSFVAIEHRETPVEGRAELRRVPVALTSGWGALREQDATGSFRVPAAASMAPVSTHQGTVIGFSAPYGGDSAEARSGDGPFDGSFSESFEGALDGDAAPAAHGPFYRVAQVPREEPLEPAHAPRDLDRLVALQSADGSWDLTPEFAEIIGRSLDELEAELRGAPGGRVVARRVAATSLALEWLEREATADRAEWEMLAEKARRWLAGHGASPVG